MLAVAYSVDLAYQKRVFSLFVLMALVNSFDYPYFISSRKLDCKKVPLRYLLFAIFALSGLFWLGALVQNSSDYIYCLVLILTQYIFYGVYQSELKGKIFNSSCLGLLRSLSVSVALILVSLLKLKLLILQLVILILFSVKKTIIEADNAEEGQPFNQLELLGYWVAAFLAAIFFVIDRYAAAYMFPEYIKEINLIFICNSIVLLISNIFAAYFSVSVSFIKKSRSLFFECVIITSISALCVFLYSNQFNLIMLVVMLTVSPVIFSLQSAILLKIQHDYDANSTSLSYLVVVLMKLIILYSYLSGHITNIALMFVPLLGLVTPVLIVYSSGKLYEKF